MEVGMPIEKLNKQASAISTNPSDYQKLLSFIGDLLIGNLTLPKLLVLRGDGNNGKTTFIDLVIEYMRSLNLRSIRFNATLLSNYENVPLNYGSINLIILTGDIRLEDINLKKLLIPHKLHIYDTNQAGLKIPVELKEYVEIVECDRTFD